MAGLLGSIELNSMAESLLSPSSSLPMQGIDPPTTVSNAYGVILIVAVAILLAVLFISILLSILVGIYLIRSRVTGRRLNFQSLRIFRNSGLDKRILESMPVFAYSEGEEALECPVCLSEFEAGEKGRLVPNCGHKFHVICIDAWFESHSTCPICRSDLGLSGSGNLIEESRTQDVVVLINSGANSNCSGASTSACVHGA